MKQDHLGFILKGDELRYVINILYEQHFTGELPTSILEIFIQNLNVVSSITKKNEEVLEELGIAASKLKDIQDNEIYVKCKILENNISSGNIRAELIFKERPIISPNVFFSYINQQCNSKITIVGERKGSYILTIICTAYGIGQIFKFLKYLTGNSLEICKNGIIIKELITNKEFRDKYKKQVINDTLNTNNKGTIDQQAGITINKTINNVESSVFANIIKSPNYGGYDHDNLCKINIIN